MYVLPVLRWQSAGFPPTSYSQKYIWTLDYYGGGGGGGEGEEEEE